MRLPATLSLSLPLLLSLCLLSPALLFSVGSVQARPRAQEKPIAIAVLPVKLLTGATGKVDPQLFDEVLLAAVQDVGGYRVIGRSDMDAVLGYEKQKDLVNCDDVQCFAEIGAAFGADRLVDVAVAYTGGEWTVTAKMIRISGGAPTVQGRIATPVTGSTKDLFVALPMAIRELAARSGLEVKSTSEIAFAPLAITSAPQVSTAVDSGRPNTLSSINLEAEKMLETAIDTEELPAARAKDKAAAWCALSRVTNNPYQDRATKACDEWTRYIESQSQIRSDFEIVQGYLALQRKTNAQKLAVLDAFLAAHGHLDVPEVRATVDARLRLIGPPKSQKRSADGREECSSAGSLGCDPVFLKTSGLILELVKNSVVVVRCREQAPCGLANLRSGDVVDKVNGKKITSTAQAARLIDESLGEADINLVVFRDGTMHPITLRKL